MILLPRSAPSQDEWAERLRGSMSAAATEVDPSTGAFFEEGAGLDDFIGRMITDIDRHVAATTAMRKRAKGLRSEAAAALRAASGTDTALHGRAGETSVTGQPVPESTLDIRR